MFIIFIYTTQESFIEGFCAITLCGTCWHAALTTISI